MSVNIKRNGTLQKLADQTLIFQANSAETRSGTITIPAISEINGNQSVQVVFSGPMPDTNYEVIIDEGADTWAHLTATVTNKTTTGFTLMVVTLVPNMPQLNFHYTAFKLVTLEGYSLVQSKVSNPDSTPVENSTNLVTSGGVYDAIKNASSVFIGTSSEWESESAKTDYQVAILTDQPTVNAVDSTDGTTTVVANKNLVFKGTLEEWEALTTAEKKTYDQALITNDMDTGEVVNGVTDGDMRAVTSNAVYDAITDLAPVDTVTNGNMKAVTSNAVYDAINVTKGTINYTNTNGDVTLNWMKSGRTIIYNIYVFNVTTGGDWSGWNITLPQEIRPIFTAEGMKTALVWGGKIAGEAYVSYDAGYIAINIYGDFTSASGQIVAFV